MLTTYLATAATGLPAGVLPRRAWSGAILLFAQCLWVVTMITVLDPSPKRQRGVILRPRRSRSGL